MLKKKSIFRKVLEFKAKNRKPNFEESFESKKDLPLWKKLVETAVDNPEDHAISHSAGSNQSENKSKIFADDTTPLSQVDKDNYQGCPSISFEGDNPIAECLPQVLHDDDKEEIEKLKDQMSGSKILKEASFSFKSNLAVNDFSFHYRVIRKRSKSRKVTKSFCRSPRRVLEFERRLSSVGRKRRKVKASSPKPQKGRALPCKPLHELRAAISNYSYTRKRSIQLEVKEEEESLRLLVEEHIPLGPKHRGNKTSIPSLFAFTSPRKTVVFPCFDDSVVHKFHEDEFKTNLMPNKKDEDNDSSDSLIKYSMEKAYQNLKKRVDEYNLHKPTPSNLTSRKPKTPDNHIKLKDGWVQIKPKLQTTLLQENPLILKQYQELIQKTKNKVKQNEEKNAALQVSDSNVESENQKKEDFPPSKTSQTKLDE